MPEIRIDRVEYIAGYVDVRSCPQDGKPVYAFIGRSNVGKSSLINMLCDRKEIARVSGNPGKTQLINYYAVDEEWYIADLPGYGYAKVSKKSRKKWKSMICDFLEFHPFLMCGFLLIDIRHPLQQIDLDFINWMGEKEIPFSLLFTKADKLRETDWPDRVDHFRHKLSEYWSEMPGYFITSSILAVGKQEILHYINKLNNIASGVE